MTSQQKLNLKLKILHELKGLNLTLVDVFDLFDDLKSEFSNIVIEKELKKLKFKE